LIGSVVAAGGLLGIIGGFGLALDDSFVGGPETGLPVLAVGAALFYAGAKIAGNRKTYKKEKWQIRLTPTEYVKQPLDPYEFRVGSQ
jgi:hypothetical protein